MCKPMQILQLNMQKRREVQHSVLNDASLKGYTALAIGEPYVFEMDGKVRTSPMGHESWAAILPSARHDGRWAVRSMLWVCKDIDCEQVNVLSADLMVALLRLPDRSVLLASVYVEGSNTAALSETMRFLDDVISTAQRRSGRPLDAVVAGDFNRHDQLWGGEGTLPARQGEADSTNDFMNRWSLESLLPRGTKTWQNTTRASTIDLKLASQELASDVLTRYTRRSTDQIIARLSRRFTLKSQITPPNLGCYSRTLPGMRSKSVSTKRCTIDPRAETFRDKLMVQCRWSWKQLTR